ncbi:MAG TPA: hypothetical protein VNW06_03255 [Cytophagaceae bacterium]|jgi:hypothetical protein|nr:hypothetical protein [Cytophagaceae bacterium]
MDFNFQFNHSNLSILVLHQNGIRSLLELEQVIQGDSFAEELQSEIRGRSIFIATGFTVKSKPLKVAFSLNTQGEIITLQAKIATISEIKEGFCKHCK